MIAWLVRHPLVVALAGLGVLLLVLIGVEAGFGPRITQAQGGEPVKAARPPEAKLLPPVVAQAPDQVYPEMAARPLFTPTRRLAPTEPAGGKPAFAHGQYVLQGVIVVGDQRTALLREKASGRVHRVDRGKELNGITVESVEPTQVTLVMGGERENVALVVQRPEGAARAGAPTAGEPAQGPFGAASASAPVPARAEAPQAGAPVAIQAPGAATNPAARAVSPGSPRASQPTTQPMSPEELLARRRARRNQPTQ